MRTRHRFVSVAALLAAGCGGGGGSGGSGDAPPVVAITAPSSAVEVSRGAAVDVSYTSADADGEALTTLVADLDGDLATAGDSIVIATAQPETGAVPRTVSWDTTGVAEGDYTIFARASDGVNAEQVAAGPEPVTVSNVAFAHGSTGQWRAIAALPDGSCVVAGHFFGATTLDAGAPGETTLLAAGGPADQDVFVARFGADGHVAWARRAGGPGHERCDTIAAAADGSFVIAGLFQSADSVFGPGEPGETTLPAGGASDLFVASYDAAGRVEWATAARGNLFVAQAARFADGSCVVAGNFLGVVGFGAGESEETVLTAPGGPSSYQGFVARFAPDGALAWARMAGGEDTDYAQSVVAFPDGTCAVTGAFRGEAAFGAGEPGETVLSTDEYDFYLARLGADGDLAWVVRADASQDETYTGGAALADGGDGSCLVAGTVLGAAVFGAGRPDETEIVSESATGDSFVARYEADGSLAWVQRVLSSPLGGVSSVALTLDGGFAVAGSMGGSTTFDPHGAAETLTAVASRQDVFVAQFDADGVLDWASRAGGSLDDRGWGLAPFSDGSFGVVGSFLDVAVFGAGDAHESVLGPAARMESFVARWNADGGF